MDTELLRTFLEVGKTRHFGRAADNLYLTQSAVSFRIRQLEGQLGSPLFSRQRGNIRLTAAGERLLPYAESILNTWGHAKQDVALSDDAMTQLSIGASNSIWDLGGLPTWVRKLNAELNNTAFRLLSLNRQDIMRALLEHNIDVALLGDPPKVDGFNLKEVASFEFKLTSNQANLDFEALPDLPLLYLDWGTRFSIEFARIAPLQRPPLLHSSSSRVLIDFLIHQPSIAYLPEPALSSALKNEQLFLVDNAPIMEQTLYLCWHQDSEKASLIESLLEVPIPNLYQSY